MLNDYLKLQKPTDIQDECPFNVLMITASSKDELEKKKEIYLKNGYEEMTKEDFKYKNWGLIRIPVVPFPLPELDSIAQQDTLSLLR